MGALQHDPQGGDVRPLDSNNGKMPRRQRGGSGNHTALDIPTEKMPRRQTGGGGRQSPKPVLR